MQRLLDSRLPLLACLPQKVFNLSYMESLHRAGALPVLDAEFMDTETLLEAGRTLDEKNILFAIRVPLSRKDLLEKLKKNPPRYLEALIFSYDFEDALKNLDLKAWPVKRLLEIKHTGHGPELSRMGVHGLVLKGLEAGGSVSRHTALILMQEYLEASNLPLFIHGGVGMHTAAGFFSAGASGLVLDAQLWLCRESPLGENFRKLLHGMEDLDTLLLEGPEGSRYRFFARLGTRVAQDLKKLEPRFVLGADQKSEEARILSETLKEKMADLSDGSAESVQSLFYLGQDAVFARHFLRRGDGVEAMIHGLFEEVRKSLAVLETADPLRAGSPLAMEHGVRYPIMQGPMANISDNADFAEKVAEAGGLPFFAMGSLPVPLAETMLEKASEKGIPCGAGLIGIEAFNRRLAEHMDLTRKFNIPFALIAGGSPAQVRELEASGIRTYLHTPATRMLENALVGGVSRFILEGTECGGHVGSLSSLVLWEMGTELLSQLEDAALQEKTLVYAGGISTEAASHFISGMAAGLSQRGLKIGIQVGTAYLFTREIVETGALHARYQKEVLHQKETQVIGRTVGLPSRTLASPFSLRMRELEHSRMEKGDPLSERKDAFEKDNMGSLLIAAKGMVPDFSGKSLECEMLKEEDIFEKGNFCVGDSLVFFQDTCTIKSIHAHLFENKTALRRHLDSLERLTRPDGEIYDEIAVVGMGCVLPDAPSPEAFWENILHRHVSIRKMEESRLPSLYVSEDKGAEDKSYTSVAADVRGFTFDPVTYGLDAKTGARLSRSQQLVLEAAYQAANSGGFSVQNSKGSKTLPLETPVILASCLGNELTHDLHMKYWTPEILSVLKDLQEFEALEEGEKAALVKEIRESLAGKFRNEPPDTAVLNIEASRVAACLGVEGPNYLIDAACATSFAALDCAMQELLSGRAQAAIVGGINTNLAPETFVGFSKMGALSAQGSWPFDGRADGFVLGEGAVVFILKRMRDAMAEGDKIFGVIRGMGASSDGKGKAIAAPNVKGQILAMGRAFENMKRPASPEAVTFLEAHGTSTRMGDAAELESVKGFYGKNPSLGVSSAKSQVGHLLGGAGAAGLLKALLALNHRILPPNGDFEELGPVHDLSGTGIFVVKEASPWPSEKDQPLLAAVSAYGFGGINYHCVLEAPTPDYRPLKREVFPDLSFDPNDQRIVVAGMGLVLPGTGDEKSFMETMASGKSLLTEKAHLGFDAKTYAEEDREYRIPFLKAGLCRDFTFDAMRFRIPPKSLAFIDRGQLLALTAADRAIRGAGLEEALKTPANRVGVMLGAISSTRHVENILRIRLDFVAACMEKTKGLSPEKSAKLAEALTAVFRKRLPPNTEDTTPGLLTNIVSGRVANVLNCNGPNFTVDAACASSGFALRAAMMHLVSGRCDYVISGGVDSAFYPAALLVFKRLGLLSKDGTRFWDKGKSQGVNLSEGAAVQVLTTYGKAKEKGLPILGEIRSIAMASRAGESVFALSENLLAREMRAAYREAGMLPSDLHHLDPFGFGHRIPDSMEKRAVHMGLDGASGISFGNIKPEYGYYKGANPAIILSRLLLMQKNRKRLPHHSFDPETTLMEAGGPLVSPDAAEDLGQMRRPALATNLHGFGGNHGHMVVSALPPFLRKEEAGKEERRTDSLQPSLVLPATLSGMSVLLSGQGAQKVGMMRELYGAYPEIRSLGDGAERLFQAKRGKSLLRLMFEGKGGDLNHTENTQPAVFLASAAIHSLLVKKGLKPDAWLGHSLGEYTALFASGALDFDAAFSLVLARSSLMQRAAGDFPGSIMAVFKGPQEVADLIAAFNAEGVYIANKNAPGQTVVSGEKTAMLRFGEFLTQKSVLFRKLNLSGAFHTPLFADAAKGMAKALAPLRFQTKALPRIISNVTAKPYPEDENAVKELLTRQMVSPVEFMEGVRHLYDQGCRSFLEVGPGNLLARLVDSHRLEGLDLRSAIDPKKGETASMEALLVSLGSKNSLSEKRETPPQPKNHTTGNQTQVRGNAAMKKDQTQGFAAFLEANRSRMEAALLEEYEKEQEGLRLKAYENFGFYTGAVSIAGVSVGLPGSGRAVFSDDHFESLIEGQNFIEALGQEEKEAMFQRKIRRLHKTPEGNARFVDIASTDEVIHLAGKLGFFDPEGEYGLEKGQDISIALAMAAGLEALKDARIPLLEGQSRAGSRLAGEELALPASMQETTGVIFTGLFPGWETLIHEMEAFQQHRYQDGPGRALESLYYDLMETLSDRSLKERVAGWFHAIRPLWEKKEPYRFDSTFLDKITPLASAHFAKLIRARGPNVHLSGACASTTQAIAVAEDWIRSGRCERVVVIGSETATASGQGPWISAGFLSLGAASIEKEISRAAKPFDADRNGTLLGAGATALVVERRDLLRARGLEGQAEILGTFLANAAFHTTRIDVPYLAGTMARFVRQVETRHGLDPESYASRMVFMSHETFTPARGGSADAEIEALRAAYGRDAGKITITNTKGLTGHTLGAAIEDAVMVKALQRGQTPPVAHLKKVPEHFSDLKFSRGEKGDFQYGLHFSAGFGSHFALLMVKRTEERATENNAAYEAWLSAISGMEKPGLRMKNRVLVLATAPGFSGESLPAGVGEKAPAPPVKAKTVKAEPKVSSRVKILEEIRNILSEQTGYGTDMLAEDLDLEADLGIDTVKQVEIFSKVMGHFGLGAEEDAPLRELSTLGKIADYIAVQSGAVSLNVREKASTAGASGREAILTAIRDILSEQTGYGTDMLAEDLDLEADLGIDTVKQVEIFSKVMGHFGLGAEEDAPLRELSTLGKIADYIAAQSGALPLEEKEETAISSAGASGREAILTAIRDILSEQTGYGTDMLAEALDLEADLGIDTVKQVEIFSKVMGHFGLGAEEDAPLRELSTLGKIADYIAAQKGASAPEEDGRQTDPVAESPGSEDESSLLPADPGHSEKGLFRFVPDVRKAPAEAGPRFGISGRKVLVTLDDQGLAAPVVEALEAAGAVILTAGRDRGDYLLEDRDAEKSALLFGEIAKEHPDLCGLVLLHPLNTEVPEGRERMPAALFTAIHALRESLNRQGAFIAMPAFQSVIFPTAMGIREGEMRPDPVQAAFSGFLKSLAREFPHTRIKVTDFGDRRFDAPSMASRFVKELLTGDGRVETGFVGETRFLPTLLEKKTQGQKNILSGCTVLVTGGAGGITFEMVKALAEEEKDVAFILVGRSDLKDLTPDTAGLSLKDLMARLAEKMPGLSPLHLKKTAERMQGLHRTAERLRLLEEKGVSVRYVSADVTDAAAVQKLAESFPEVDAIIHGAGVEESQVFDKKTLDSFLRVFTPKVRGMAHLLAAFSGHDLKAIFAFSSVTARFGNAGQCDYTAANDMLGKMVLAEQVKRPHCVTKVLAWTAWEGTGMATRGSVKTVLESRGLTFLPLDAGIRFFLGECRSPEPCEAVFTGKDRAFDPDGLLPLAGQGPVLDAFLDAGLEPDGKTARFVRTLTLERDLFLKDHSLDGVPLFLGATGLETLAEAALQVSGRRYVTEIEEFSIPYGIKLLKNRPKRLEIRAKGPEADSVTVEMLSSFTRPGSSESTETLHYTGRVQTADLRPGVQLMAIPDLPGLRHKGSLGDLIYRPTRLFMDGVFRSIESVAGFDGRQLVTLMRDPGQGFFFAGVKGPDFRIPVVLLDAMFQTGGLFNMLGKGTPVLPSSFSRMRIFDMPEARTAYVCVTEKKAELEKTDLFDMALVDANGRLMVRVEDFQMIRIPAAAGFSLEGEVEAFGVKKVS